MTIPGALLIFCFVISGCTHLKVDVHVFNRESADCLKQPIGINVAKVFEGVKAKRPKLSQLPEKDFNDSFNNPKIRQEFERAYKSNNPDLKSTWGRDLLSDLAERTQDTQLKEEIKGADTIEVFNAAEATVANASGTYGDSILEEKSASKVLYAPESCWTRTYGIAEGTGIFGNSDIAIKMQSPGDFVIKGLRLDAAKMTQALFKGLNQGLLLAATAYGIPMPRPNGQTSSADPDPIYDEVLTADRQALDAQFSLRQGTGRSLRLFEEIVAQKASLESSDASVWKQGYQNIKDSVLNFKTLTAAQGSQ